MDTNMGLEGCIATVGLFPRGVYEKIGYQLFLEYPDYRDNYVSLASKYDIAFLLGIISSYEFINGRKISSVLEIGVYNGVTSLYMLKEGCKRDFDLYGIEIGETSFFGQAVYSEATSEELEHYHLYKKSTSFDIEEVLADKKIDMVFIDAGHAHPHPIIDLIHIIPFLHEESIIMLHDVVNYMRPNAWGASFIYCGWSGEKAQTVNLDEHLRPTTDTSLGCIAIPASKQQLYKDIERIAKVPFRASPRQHVGNYLGIDHTQLKKLRLFMEKYYDKDFSENVYNLLKVNLDEYNDNYLLHMHETKFLNYLFERSLEQERIIVDMQKKLEEIHQCNQ